MTEPTQEVGRMMMLPARPGTCAMCATAHGENDPHNYWSMFYSIRFANKYGRHATHADVVAHLTPVRRAEYRQAAENCGVEWSEPEDGQPIAEPYAVAGESLPHT